MLWQSGKQCRINKKMAALSGSHFIL